MVFKYNYFVVNLVRWLSGKHGELAYDLPSPSHRSGFPWRQAAKDKLNTPHGLSEEFSRQMDRIHALEISDPSYAQLLIDVNVVDAEFHATERKGRRAIED